MNVVYNLSMNESFVLKWLNSLMVFNLILPFLPQINIVSKKKVLLVIWQINSWFS